LAGLVSANGFLGASVIFIKMAQPIFGAVALTTAIFLAVYVLVKYNLNVETRPNNLDPSGGHAAAEPGKNLEQKHAGLEVKKGGNKQKKRMQFEEKQEVQDLQSELQIHDQIVIWKDQRIEKDNFILKDSMIWINNYRDYNLLKIHNNKSDNRDIIEAEVDYDKGVTKKSATIFNQDFLFYSLN